MSRSNWKGPYICNNLYKKLIAANFFNLKDIEIYTYSRNTQIIDDFIGLHFKVYNGKRFFNVFVTEELIGYKLGEFAFTRRLSNNIHINKTKRHLKKKKK